jgi:cytochrome c oxidase assembly protein Cox11
VSRSEFSSKFSRQLGAEAMTSRDSRQLGDTSVAIAIRFESDLIAKMRWKGQAREYPLSAERTGSKSNNT